MVYRHNRTENEWHKATELINQALAIGIKTNDLEIIHQAYNYMGDFHIIRHLYDKALVFYEKEIPYFDKYGAGKELVYLEGRRTNYAYLAICYRQLNNDVKAREYLDKFLKVNNPEDGAYANYLYHTVLSEISNYELNTKKNEKKALKYRLLYENILHERPLFDVANHYFAMFKIYRALKLNGKALEYHEKWVSAKDSLKAEELSKEFRKIETQYNVQRKELEIKILQNTTLLKENEKQQTIRNFLILTSILGFGLIIILVSYNSSRRKNNALQLNLSLVQKEITEKILQTQETERQRIASDLHDDLGGSIATVKRYMAEIKEKNKQNELKKIVDNIEPIIHQTSEDIRRISHNLMPPEFERLGLQNSIQYLVNRSSTPKVQIQFLTFGNVHLLEAEVSINIYRIVSELINNLLKHSRATLATVQMIYYEKYLSVIVEDNGTGHQIVKEPQKGIGLKSIFLRAKYIGATLKVDSGPQGSTYILEIGFK
ncbi:ATP-binding protein [Emticicia fontis]